MLGLPFHNGYRRGRSRTPIWYHQPGSSVAVGQAKTLQHPPELLLAAASSSVPQVPRDVRSSVRS